MNIPKSMQSNSIEHRYAGNGWAIVQMLDNENCRLANYFQNKEGKWKVGNQLFLAWQKLLKPEPERKLDEHKNFVLTGRNVALPLEVLEIIDSIRTKLASGKWVVKNTRLVEVA